MYATVGPAVPEVDTIRNHMSCVRTCRAQTQPVQACQTFAEPQPLGGVWA